MFVSLKLKNHNGLKIVINSSHLAFYEDLEAGPGAKVVLVNGMAREVVETATQITNRLKLAVGATAQENNG